MSSVVSLVFRQYSCSCDSPKQCICNRGLEEDPMITLKNIVTSIINEMPKEPRPKSVPDHNSHNSRISVQVSKRIKDMQSIQIATSTSTEDDNSAVTNSISLNSKPFQQQQPLTSRNLEDPLSKRQLSQTLSNFSYRPQTLRNRSAARYQQQQVSNLSSSLKFSSNLKVSLPLVNAIKSFDMQSPQVEIT